MRAELAVKPAAAKAGPPVVVTQPVDQTVRALLPTVFRVEASADPVPEFAWQYKTPIGGKWLNLADGAVCSGTATPSLTLPAPTVAMSGYQFRCIVRNSLGAVMSVAATLKVTELVAPSISRQPRDQPVALRPYRPDLYNQAVFSITASGDPPPKYQWQFRAHAEDDWSDVTNSDADDPVYRGATTPQLHITAEANMNGDQFRCVVTNAAGSAASEIGTLTVQKTP